MEEIKVVYEDGEIVVVEKPAGITSTAENSRVFSVEDWMKAERRNGLKREGIVHRLDIGTSGLMVVAKTAESLEFLLKQFKERKVDKRYLALVGGNLPFEGEVNMPIGRSKYGFGKYAVKENGKPARSSFDTLKKYQKEGKIYSLIEVKLYSGRTHQIRVHFKYLGWPLVGDRTYGGDNTEGLGRPFLHAYKLGIVHPKSGKRMVWESHLPEQLEEYLKIYEKID
jgi:23S rRNA pseudouridine1911/1915/1917 synthase